MSSRPWDAGPHENRGVMDLISVAQTDELCRFVAEWWESGGQELVAQSPVCCAGPAALILDPVLRGRVIGDMIRVTGGHDMLVDVPSALRPRIFEIAVLSCVAIIPGDDFS